jgi:hypothetical protein
MHGQVIVLLCGLQRRLAPVALARSIEMAQKPRKAQPASTISTTGKPQDYFAINADYRS